MIKMRLGERLKELRLERGLLQGELAALAKVKQPTLSKYEKNLVPNPRTPIMLKIAAALETTPEYLMHGTGPKSINDVSSNIQDLVQACEGIPKDVIAMFIATANAYKK